MKVVRTLAPSFMQICGLTITLTAVGALTSPWVAVGIGGLIIVVIGYILEPDGA